MWTLMLEINTDPRIDVDAPPPAGTKPADSSLDVVP
jgi:hypothetical protein